MSIPDHIKQPILRSFHIHTVTPGWHYDDSGPAEKDRQLLVEYHTVVEEVNRLLPAYALLPSLPLFISVPLFNPIFTSSYKSIIIDICLKMETGMADYAHKAATTGSIYLDRVWEYDLYCHYVAGLVGEGLSRLFSASGKEADWLASQLEISNSVGLLLQKTNIIRDFREDVDERRFFWPREIWGREEYGCGAGAFKEMRDMYAPGNELRAAWVQSGMIVDALRHATDALDYVQYLRNQSVFNFVAIPVTMAMATLSLCFMNPAMFQRNIKIRKAEAASVCLFSPKTLFLLTDEVAADYAIDQPPRRRVHLPRLCPQDSRQSSPYRSQLSAPIRGLRQGTR